MLDALRETGRRSSSIFLKRDGPLVGYLEAEDFEKYFAKMEAHSVNACFIGPTRSDPIFT